MSEFEDIRFVSGLERQELNLKPIAAWGKKPKLYSTLELSGKEVDKSLHGNWLFCGINEDGTFKLRRESANPIRPTLR